MSNNLRGRPATPSGLMTNMMNANGRNGNGNGSVTSSPTGKNKPNLYGGARVNNGKKNKGFKVGNRKTVFGRLFNTAKRLSLRQLMAGAFMATLLYGAQNYSPTKNKPSALPSTALATRGITFNKPSSLSSTNILNYGLRINTMGKQPLINPVTGEILTGVIPFKVGNYSIPIAATAAAQIFTSDPAKLMAKFSYTPPEGASQLEKSAAAALNSMNFTMIQTLIFQGILAAYENNPCPVWEGQKLSKSEYKVKVVKSVGMFGNILEKEPMKFNSFYNAQKGVEELMRQYRVQYSSLSPSQTYKNTQRVLKNINTKTCATEKRNITNKQAAAFIKSFTQKDFFDASMDIARAMQPSFFNRLSEGIPTAIASAIKISLSIFLVGLATIVAFRSDTEGKLGESAGVTLRKLMIGAFVGKKNLTPAQVQAVAAQAVGVKTLNAVTNGTCGVPVQEQVEAAKALQEAMPIIQAATVDAIQAQQAVEQLNRQQKAALKSAQNAAAAAANRVRAVTAGAKQNNRAVVAAVNKSRAATVMAVNKPTPTNVSKAAAAISTAAAQAGRAVAQAAAGPSSGLDQAKQNKLNAALRAANTAAVLAKQPILSPAAEIAKLMAAGGPKLKPVSARSPGKRPNVQKTARERLLNEVRAGVATRRKAMTPSRSGSSGSSSG